MVATLRESSRELWCFLKNPKDQSAADQDLSHKFKQLFTVLLINMAFLMVVMAPLWEVIERLELVNMDKHVMNKLIAKLSTWQILLLVGVIAPILEELIFRTFLTFKRNLPLQLVITLAGLGGIRTQARVSAYVKKKWRTYYLFIFYATALFFAYIHLSNFESTASIWLLSPLLVLPQFCAGLTFGYIRVRFGLVWGMLLHSMHNLILIGTSLWFVQQAG